MFPVSLIKSFIKGEIYMGKALDLTNQRFGRLIDI